VSGRNVGVRVGSFFCIRGFRGGVVARRLSSGRLNASRGRSRLMGGGAGCLLGGCGWSLFGGGLGWLGGFGGFDWMGCWMVLGGRVGEIWCGFRVGGWFWRLVSAGRGLVV